ncbi:MAG: tape measure protein [Micrococcales bacterium]|nr:tape measure protein [Micrococcales bacterium]
MSLDLGTLVAYIKADDSQYNQALDRSEGRMHRFGSAIATGVKVAGGAFLTVAGAATALGVRTAASNEQAQISFTTMLGSAKNAQSFLTQLSSFAAKTPFEFPELQTAAQSLISVGVDAKKVIPIMTSLGNATSGMGTGSEGVKRATVALQQMNAAGKISMEDLNQLRDAGIPVYDLLAAATGKSVTQVAALANKGKLGRKELGQLMTALENGKGLERFSGMMEKQSTSLTGLWSTLKDTFSMGMAQAIQPLVPLIKDGLGKAIEFASAAMPRLQAGIATVVAAAQGLYSLLAEGDYTGKLSEAFGWEEDSAAVGRILDIRNAAQGLFDLVFRGDYTGKLSQAFGWEEDSGAVAQILQIRDAVTGLFDKLRGAGGGIDFAPIGNMLGQVASHAGDITAVGPALGPTLSMIGDGLSWVADNADTVGKYLPAVLAAFTAYKGLQAANNVLGRDSAIGMVGQIGSTVALVIANNRLAASQRAVRASTVSATTAEGASMATRARAAAASVAGAARTAAAWIASNATTAASSVASAATTSAAWVASSARTVGGLVAQGAAFVAMRAAQLAGAAATGIATAAQWLWNAALTANPIGIVVVAIAALVAGIVLAWKNSETFRTIVLAAWGAIRNGIGAVVDWLKVAVPAVVAFVKNAFLRYTPLGIIISHWGQIRSVIGAAVDWIRGAIAWFGSLPGRFASWFGGVVSSVNTKVAAVVTLIKGLPGRILTGLGNLKDLLIDKGVDLVQGMITGIGNMAGRLASFVKQFVKDHIPGPIADALGISSPSKVARDLLRWVPLGGIEGLKQTGPQLRRAMTDLFQPPPVPEVLAASSRSLGARTVLDPNVSRSAAAGYGMALPEKVTLVDEEGAVMGRMRVVASDVVQSHSREQARGILSSRGGR